MKIFYKSAGLILALMAFAFHARGQGSYFSQQNFASLLYNPAAPALKDEMALSLNYRNLQSKSQLSINSLYFSAIRPFYNKDKSRRWGGLGVHVFNDKAEELGTLTNQQLAASFAYNIPIFKKHFLALGAQGMYGQNRFAFEGITTGSQWIRNRGFDPTAATGEQLGSDRKAYWSTAIGFMFYKEKEEGGHAYQLGFSAYDLNQPELSFSGSLYKQSMTYKAQASLEVLDRHNFSVAPELIWQKRAQEQLWSVGSVVKYKFVNNNPFDPIASGSLHFIARTNIKEAVVFGIQLAQPGYAVGFSYDWGFGSGATNEPGYHATEFGISLRKSIGRKKKADLETNSLGEVRQFFNGEPQ